MLSYIQKLAVLWDKGRWNDGGIIREDKKGDLGVVSRRKVKAKGTAFMHSLWPQVNTGSGDA